MAAGKFRTLGNHTYPQILKHLALIMHGSIDGIDSKAPWIVRLIMPLFKKRILSKTMSAGFKLPADAEGMLWPEASSLAEALDDFRKGIHRLQTESKREPSPFLGKLTREEWDQLHLRHAELHMGFVVPG